MDRISIIKARIAEIISGDNVSLHSSGTDALYEILRSLKLDKGHGVLIPSFVCERVLLPFLNLGIKVKFVDVQKRCVNAGLEQYKSAFDPKVRVLLLIYPWGYVPIDLVEIIEWAKRHNIIVIEDIASSFGLSFGGKKLGTFGDYCFGSFGHDKLCAVGGMGFSNLKNSDSVKVARKKRMSLRWNYNTFIKVLRKRRFGKIRPLTLYILSKIPRISFRNKTTSSSLDSLLDNLARYSNELDKRKSLTEFYIHAFKDNLDVKVMRPNNDQGVALRAACVFATKSARMVVTSKAERYGLWLGKDYGVPLHEWSRLPAQNLDETNYLREHLVNLITNPANTHSKRVVEMIQCSYDQGK